MEIDFLGGALEVGGSSVLVCICNKNILFDAGIRQGANKDPIPNFRDIQDYGGLDAIIISHAHLDHIGCLPIISKEYPNAKIYMNNMTKDLLKVLLYDSLKIMNNRDAEIPLYAEVDVENMLDRIVTINYEVKWPVFENIFVTFYNAGHIAGASCVYVQTLEGAVFYSGDFSVFSQRTVEGVKLPKLRPDVAIVESTYGDKLHSNREIEEKSLINIVNECIEKEGKMIIPAFALGRAQEVILILKAAINKKSLKKVKIYVDGMVRDINRVYNRNPLYLKNSLGKKILRGTSPFYDDNIIEVKATDNREDILSKKGPVIVISSSGMLTGGPSTFYAEKIASMENGYIIITGYQDEESPGRKILELLEADAESERYLTINGINIPVKCNIKKIGLSAHSDKSEIKGVLEKISSKNIFLVHGNEDVIHSLSKEISSEFIGKTFAPACGEKVSIDIKNPRKQFDKTFPNILNKKENISESNISEFWEFIISNYNKQLFTLEELNYIWTGKKNLKGIKQFRDIIINCLYFESDIKRLFMFRARDIDDINSDLKPKEFTPQMLNDIVDKKFEGFNYKRIGIMLENKEIILNFDFPHAVDSSINTIIDEFTNETGWKVGMNEKINNNSAELLIRKLLDLVNIKKISFYPEKLSVQVLVNEKQRCKNDVCQEFKKITGWDMYINTKTVDSEIDIKKDRYFKVDKKKASVEQNTALELIEKSFKLEQYKPYKKGIKSNSDGKYIELTFISPNIGNMFTEKVKKLSYEIGWNISISDKVNQNELNNIVKLICDKNDVVLKRNPSYNPNNMSVYLSIISGKDKFQIVKEEFEKATGCLLCIL